ncbi:hypothetical protein FF38_09727 [Lucilia cuprina]|uniref:Uncharacterized protein n=1 Tax=Lucilia cuprina TaxID=7375 RepID=A0A0L0BUI3_LUCCU|nr:hypothetical protein FF38_09727 [Lucilia cuprina]
MFKKKNIRPSKSKFGPSLEKELAIAAELAQRKSPSRIYMSRGPLTSIENGSGPATGHYFKKECRDEIEETRTVNMNEVEEKPEIIDNGYKPVKSEVNMLQQVPTPQSLLPKENMVPKLPYYNYNNERALCVYNDGQYEPSSEVVDEIEIEMNPKENRMQHQALKNQFRTPRSSVFPDSEKFQPPRRKSNFIPGSPRIENFDAITRENFRDIQELKGTERKLEDFSNIKETPSQMSSISLVLSPEDTSKSNNDTSVKGRLNHPDNRNNIQSNLLSPNNQLKSDEVPYSSHDPMKQDTKNENRTISELEIAEVANPTQRPNPSAVMVDNGIELEETFIPRPPKNATASKPSLMVVTMGKIAIVYLRANDLTDIDLPITVIIREAIIQKNASHNFSVLFQIFLPKNWNVKINIRPIIPQIEIPANAPNHTWNLSFRYNLSVSGLVSPSWSNERFKKDKSTLTIIALSSASLKRRKNTCTEK